MISLNQYGWNSFHQSENIEEGLIIGRVVSIQGFKYFLITEHGELEAELSGKLMYGASGEELPKLGDWVTVMRYDSMGYIFATLPRKNELARKNPGGKFERQILATNIDGALIVQGLDINFNIMRLERYLVQLAACSINAVVILNKCDLIDDKDKYRSEIEKLQRDCEVHFCSTMTGEGLTSLTTDVLQKNKTYILIGSSGVGKSSLLNALMNDTQQAVSATSDHNNKGRHTTTTRDLFKLPNGSLLIDTPGMREFGLTSEAGESDELFPAISRFSVNCKYNDCRHTNEEGCAVLEALSTGELDSAIYESYIKLFKEQRRFEINAEDKKRMNKQFGKMTREAKEHRKKYKF